MPGTGWEGAGVNGGQDSDSVLSSVEVSSVIVVGVSIVVVSYLKEVVSIMVIIAVCSSGQCIVKYSSGQYSVHHYSGQ